MSKHKTNAHVGIEIAKSLNREILNFYHEKS